MHQRLDRKHIHHLRPCFVVDPKLQEHLIRYKGKEEVVMPKSQRSVFQKGFRMVFANHVPIAAGCQMGADVVRDCLDNIFMAMKDLIMNDQNISLQFGFANVQFINRNMKVYFADSMTKQLTDKEFEGTMKRQASPVAELWRTNTSSMFNKSSLGTLIKKPNAQVNEALFQKTQALKMMSMDMSSSIR